MTAEALDPLIHVPARLQIMAALATLPDGDQLSFKRLQDMIELTPGNLITHLRKLEEAGYLATSKTGSGPASRTSVALTHDGRHALEIYATTLRGLLNGVSAGPAASGSHLDRHGASPGLIRREAVPVTATALRERGGITTPAELQASRINGTARLLSAVSRFWRVLLNRREHLRPGHERRALRGLQGGRRTGGTGTLS